MQITDAQFCRNSSPPIQHFQHCHQSPHFQAVLRQIFCILWLSKLFNPAHCSTFGMENQNTISLWAFANPFQKKNVLASTQMRARNWTKTSSLPAKNLLGQHCVLVWPLGVQSSATEHHFLDIARAVPGSFKRNAEACVSFCGKLPRAVAVAIRRAMRTVCPAMWQKSLSEWP